MTTPPDVIRGTVHWDLATYMQYIPYLARYLSTLLAGVGRTERRVATARYIEGLLLPERRKFIRPLAERLKVDPQSLQQAITHSPWDDQQVWNAIRSEVIPLFEPLDVCMIHERSWAKQGSLSVGVSNQRCGADGKKARCQLSIELLLGNGLVAVPAAARLHLPEDWASDEERRREAEVPEDLKPGSKSDLAIELIQETIRDGITPGIVVADSSFGNKSDFRAALIRLGVEFFLEITPTSAMAWDFTAPAGQCDTALQPYSVDKIISKLGGAEWRNCAWSTADGVPRRTRIAIREIFLDSSFYAGQGTLEKCWLVVDWPADLSQPFRCYLAQFHCRPNDLRCLRLSRHRGFIEQYNRCYEGQLDLACYQGRTWRGFHHHLVLAAAAYLFVLTVDMRRRRPYCSNLCEDTPIDSAIAAEISRLASVLARNGPPSALPSFDFVRPQCAAGSQGD